MPARVIINTPYEAETAAASLLQDVEQNIAQALPSQWLQEVNPNGLNFEPSFEQDFAGYCGARYGISVKNGSVAMQLALLALGVGPGDEVIVPNFSAPAGAYAVCYIGAKPVFVDADPLTWNMDIAAVEEKITASTKAIVAVHLLGNPCNIQALRLLAYRYGLFILEDAAEAYGSQFKGQRAGSLGDIAIFNFIKQEGNDLANEGMLVTSDEKLARACRHFKSLYLSQAGARAYSSIDMGFAYRMRSLHSVDMPVQTEKANLHKSIRMQNGRMYQEFLANIPGICLQQTENWGKGVFWQNGICVIPEQYGRRRSELMSHLGAHGVETYPFGAGMHRQAAMQRFGCNCSDPFPVSDVLASRGIYLPSSSTLKPEDIKGICKLIKNFTR